MKNAPKNGDGAEAVQQRATPDLLFSLSDARPMKVMLEIQKVLHQERRDLPRLKEDIHVVIIKNEYAMEKLKTAMEAADEVSGSARRSRSAQDEFGHADEKAWKHLMQSLMPFHRAVHETTAARQSAEMVLRESEDRIRNMRKSIEFLKLFDRAPANVSDLEVDE